MKMNKKIISLFVVIAIMVSLGSHSFAASASVQVQSTELEVALETARELYPQADIFVGEDGAINIISNEVPQAITRASIYAPNGGTYRNFKRPPLTSEYALSPYAIIFLDAERTVALLNGKLKANLISSVVTAVAKYGINKATALINTEFLLALSPVGVMFLNIIGVYNAISWLDSYALQQTIAKSSSICIQRMMLQGVPSNVYMVWGGEYVTDDPYSDWAPVFYPDQYYGITD